MNRTLLFLLGALAAASAADAQITAPRMLSAAPDRFANLEEQLTNRLRATTDNQRAFVKFVVKQVKAGKLELRLIVAIERYAIRRNRDFPLPIFERALRSEAQKRGVTIPPVKSFIATAETTAR